MFGFIFAVSSIVAICSFFLLIDGNGNIITFLSSLLSTILSWKLVFLESKTKSNEKKIEKLEERLGIDNKDNTQE